MDNRRHSSETRVALSAGRVKPAHAAGQNNPTKASCLLAAALLVIPLGLKAAEPTGDRTVIERMPGLVAFWTFGEEEGQPRLSSGTRETLPLLEVGGPIARVEGGPFSGHAAELNGKQYFKIPYAETGGLNISGPEAEVSMFAVVRLVNLNQSRTIAGMWSEGKGANDDSGTRQYALLMNMPTYGGPRQLVPHISSEGGVTRRADGSAFPWCADRGMNPYYHGRGIFRYDPTKHAESKPGGGSDFTVGGRYAVGSMLGEATLGKFGGLAVFNRALTDAEMKQLHDAANLKALNK
jgi:hypothetical protein